MITAVICLCLSLLLIGSAVWLHLFAAHRTSTPDSLMYFGVVLLVVFGAMVGASQ